MSSDTTRIETEPVEFNNSFSVGDAWGSKGVKPFTEFNKPHIMTIGWFKKDRKTFLDEEIKRRSGVPVATKYVEHLDWAKMKRGGGKTILFRELKQRCY